MNVCGYDPDFLIFRVWSFQRSVKMVSRLNALAVVVVEEDREASVAAELEHLVTNQIVVAAVNQFAIVVVLLKELLDLADRSLVLLFLSLPTFFDEFLAVF